MTSPLKFVFANNAGSTLAGPINNSTTSLTLASGGGALFPNPTVGSQMFAITLIDAATGLLREICYVSAVSVDTFTITRAEEGTSPLSWLAGDLVQELWTAGQCSAMLQTNQAFLTSNTFYVNGTTGNDSNPGTNTLPFKTGQGAVNAIINYISSSGVTLNFAAGTYAGFGINASSIASWTIIGSGTSTCFVSSSTTATNNGRGIVVASNTVNITGFSVSAHFECFAAISNASVNVYNVAVVGLGSTTYGFAAYTASLFTFEFPGTGTTTNNTINVSGTFLYVFNNLSGGNMRWGYSDGYTIHNLIINFGTTTVTYVVVCQIGANLSISYSQVSFTGSTPTGARYDLTTTGGISQSGGTTSFIPASSAGTIDSTTYGYYFT